MERIRIKPLLIRRAAIFDCEFGILAVFQMTELTEHNHTSTQNLCNEEKIKVFVPRG